MFFNDEYCFSWHSGEGPNFCYYFIHKEKIGSKVYPSLWKQWVEKILKEPESQFAEGNYLDRFLKETKTTVGEAEKDFQSQGNTFKPIKGLHPRVVSRLFTNCGLCAIPILKKIGVSVLKIPSRGERGRKRKFLKVVKQVVQNPSATSEFCQGLINSPAFCSEIGSCYYYLGDSKMTDEKN